MSNFRAAIDFTLQFEGGYVNDKDDPGGATNWGISSKDNPGVDVRTLTREQAIDIYKKKYWDPLSADSLPKPLAVALFDFAVHSGVSKAVQFLQEIVGVKRDGDMGPNTKSAIASYIARSSDLTLAEELIHRRTKFLVNLCRKQPKLGKFLSGWMRRTHTLMSYIHAK